MKLTDASVKAAKAKPIAYDMPDGTVSGLSLRVTTSGKKSWSLRVRWNGRSTRTAIGEYPATRLAEARDLAREVRKAALTGQDPEHAVRPASDLTVSDALKTWMETKSTNRSAKLERRRLELHVIPAIGKSDVRTVTQAELYALLHKMAHGRHAKPVEANRTFTSLRGFFRWCRQAGLRTDDPTELLVKPTKEEPSVQRRKAGTDPLLDMGELRQLWEAAPALPGGVLPDLLRLLLLLPLRRDEITDLRWSEVHSSCVADGWTGAALVIPAARMKGKRTAIVPLSTKALEIIKARERTTGQGPYVFSVAGRETPFAGWRRGAETLRTVLGGRTDWSPHTIRKSVATALVRELKADELLVGRILQHSPKAALGVTADYQQSPRLAEQASVLEKWSVHLGSQVSKHKPDSKVITLAPNRGDI